MDDLPDGIEVRDYNETLDRIKTWIKSFEEDRIEFQKFVKK